MAYRSRTPALPQGPTRALDRQTRSARPHAPGATLTAGQAQMLAMLTQGRQRPSESEAAGEAANNESAGASSEGGGDAGSAQREEGEGSAESAGPQDKMDVDESQQPK
eukprot:530559-Hanusia_phi.AAC.1